MKIPKDFLYDHQYFENEMDDTFTINEVKRLEMRHWAFDASFPETDIVWDHLHTDSILSLVKSTVLMVLLLLFSIVLLTPLLLINMSQNVIEDTNIGASWM